MGDLFNSINIRNTPPFESCYSFRALAMERLIVSIRVKGRAWGQKTEFSQGTYFRAPLKGEATINTKEGTPGRS